MLIKADNNISINNKYIDCAKKNKKPRQLNPEIQSITSNSKKISGT